MTIQRIARPVPMWFGRVGMGVAALVAAVAASTALGAPEAPAPASRTVDGCPVLLQHTFKTLQTGEPQSLCQYQGKVLLVVNTASYCGYTKQYEGLEALYSKNRDRGIFVVGFPSNDFSQEPGTNKEIAEFCRTTYGVQFPMFEKTSVAKLAQSPFYADLAKATGQAPKWNFHKYVIDRSGRPVATFGSGVAPDARELTSLIVKLLDESPAPAAGKAAS